MTVINLLVFSTQSQVTDIPFRRATASAVRLVISGQDAAPHSIKLLLKQTIKVLEKGYIKADKTKRYSHFTGGETEALAD